MRKLREATLLLGVVCYVGWPTLLCDQDEQFWSPSLAYETLPSPEGFDIPTDVTLPQVQDEVSMNAFALLNAPYRWGGETAAGTDCSGLVVAVYRALGIELPHRAAVLFDAARPVAPEAILPGDLVFFGQRGARRPTYPHVGIYVASGDVVHASSVRGRVVAEPLAAIESRRLSGVRRILE